MNAKELQLSKLNAGIKTIGMYLYGIMIGMPFKDVANLLMSDVGYTITEAMDSNSFTGQRGVMTLSQAFDYFEIGPKAGLRKFQEKERIKGFSSQSPLDAIVRGLQLSGYTTNPPEKMIANFAWDPNVQLSEKLRILDSFNFQITDRKHENVTEPSQKGKYLFGLLKNFIKHYLYQVETLKSNLDTYNDIKQLAGGAEEAKVLGSILGLNKGLDSSPEDLMLKVMKIEGVIADRNSAIKAEEARTRHREFWKYNGKKYGKELSLYSLDNDAPISPFDLAKFVSNEEYRELCINDYEGVKHSFNILDCVSSVTHFFGYLLDLAVAFEGEKVSKRYNFCYDEGSKLFKRLGATSGKEKRRILKGVGLYYSDTVRKRWMMSLGVSFTLPKGETQIIMGLAKPTTCDVQILLGTDDGDATFKRYMEQVVFPKLQDPELSGNKIAKNKFIKDLKPGVFTNNLLHNAIIYYTLPVNMLPHNDAEAAVFDSYKSEFNKLSSDSINIGNTVIPLLEALFLYGLIAHYGKPGQLSIMGIFQDKLAQGMFAKFHAYETNFDEKILAATDIDPYVIPISDIYSSFAPVIYAEDPKTMRVVKWRLNKIERDSGEDYSSAAERFELKMRDENAINNYTIITNPAISNSDVNNYYMNGTYGNGMEYEYEGSLKFDGSQKNIEGLSGHAFNYKVITNGDKLEKITFIAFNRDIAGGYKPVTDLNEVVITKDLTLSEDLKNAINSALHIYRNGEIVINRELIDTIIDDIINCG